MTVWSLEGTFSPGLSAFGGTFSRARSKPRKGTGSGLHRWLLSSVVQKRAWDLSHGDSVGKGVTDIPAGVLDALASLGPSLSVLLALHCPWDWVVPGHGAHAAGSRRACGVPVQAVFSGRLSCSCPAPLEPTQERVVEALSPELRVLRGRPRQLGACSRWHSVGVRGRRGAAEERADPRAGRREEEDSERGDAAAPGRKDRRATQTQGDRGGVLLGHAMARKFSLGLSPIEALGDRCKPRKPMHRPVLSVMGALAAPACVLAHSR